MKIKKYKSEKSTEINGKLKSYSALTGAFLAAASGVEAQIIYHDVNPDAIVHNGIYTVDMDGSGVGDFVINQYSISGSQSYKTAGITATTQHLSNRVIAKGPSIAQYFASRLNAGALIGPSGNGFKNLLSQCISNVLPMATNFSTGSHGYWAGGKSGFIGVEFKNNGNTYYGWIDCYVANKADTVIIRGWAYNSIPNTLIHSGDSGLSTGIEQTASTLNHIGNFYPNAVKFDNTFIEIETKETADLKIEIMNELGQVLQTEEKKINNGKNILQLNVEKIADGNYFVKLAVGQQFYFRKLIVQR